MTPASPPPIPPPSVAPRWRSELGVVTGLWRRDLLRFRRDTGRWVGLVLQPLLIWWLLGSGMRDALAVPGAATTSSFVFYLPGAVAMIALFTSIFATMGVIDDRAHGFLQQVLVAPASRAALILGKAIGVLSVTLIQLALTIPAFALAGLDLATLHWPLLLGTFIPGVLAVTALSFCLAWVVRTTHAYHALMGVFLMPLWLVSGAIFPLPADGFLRWLNLGNPLAYLVDGLRHAFAGGVDPSAAFSAATPALVLLAMAGFGLGLASLIARRPVGAHA